MKQCVIHWPINNRTIMMQERCAAADTVSLVARMLHRSRTRLQSMLLQNTAIEDFYVNLVLLPYVLECLLPVMNISNLKLNTGLVTYY